MDKLILAIAKFLSKGKSVNEIHDAIIAKGWPEDKAFLAIKAGELLFESIKKAEANRKAPSFKRVL